jgi:PAS domain S-box-containing protein
MADAHFVPGLETALQAADAETLLASPPPFVDLLPIAVYACEITGRICWFNAKAAEIWGRAPAIGEPGERLCESHRVYGLDGALIEDAEAPLAHALKTGETVEGRTALIERPDGSRRVATLHVSPLRDRAGSLIGALACFHDVTDELREDRAARDGERQLSDILNALPAAIYTTDAEGRITFYNEAAVEMSGRRPELGQDEWCVTWKLYTTDGAFLPHDQCPMAVALKENRPIRGFEAVAERPDGTRIPFIPFPTPLHDASGKLIGAVNMLVDISHRKEAETQQRLLFAELNHRIKNNMQMLHALLSAGRRETRSEEARAALDDAAARVASMAAAQTVLYRSNNLARFDTRDFMDSICASAASACGEAIEIDCVASTGELSNDTAVPLALILNELVTNAAKYATDGKGGGSIRVALDEQDGLFTLTVEDDGPGFDLHDVRRRSSGLGLVAGLARQIGGSFTVERGGGENWGARCIVRFRDEASGRA